MAWRNRYGRPSPLQQARLRRAQAGSTFDRPMQHWGWNQADTYHNAGLRLSEHAGPFSPSPGYVGAAASEGWHYPLPIGQRIANSRLGAAGQRFMKGGPLTGLGLNAAFGAAMTVGTAMTESARWGAKTGYQEDYVGGWVTGWEKGKHKAAGMLIGDLAGMAIGSLVPGGTIIGGVVGSLIGDPIAEFFTRRGDYEKGRRASFNAAGAMAKRKVQFGRGFRDTEEAYTMRQMAVQEMAGSLLNARQYLGNEAFFLHR